MGKEREGKVWRERKGGGWAREGREGRGEGEGEGREGKKGNGEERREIDDMSWHCFQLSETGDG